ncbi:MAG: recombinase family protein [Lachnospiraceae bacterium]|nr:recombinase family protein [Lachnospiraceae bacterium]
MKDNELSNILDRKTGAIYIRVSTDRQEELSPDAQRRLLLDYAKEHNIDVPAEYIFQDNGISGRQAKKRPAFQNMIALAKSKEHPIDTIIVWKFSRFARNQEESIVYKSLLKKNDVDVVSISEPLVDGPFGSLIERIIEWMDEYYSIRLSGEVMRGMTENAMRGNYQSDAPIGYRSPGGGNPPVIDPDTVQIPIMIKDLFLSGSTTLQIARRLNDLGYQTKRGNLWDARGVRYVLENPFYAGKSRWNYTERGRRLKPTDEVIYADGNWEPIWDDDTVHEIQQRLAMNMRKVKSRDVSTAKHWLSGLLICSSCGSTMAFGGATNRRGFQCWKYAKGQCNESHFISTKQIEALVIGYLEQVTVANDISYSVIAAAASDNGSRLAELERQLQKIDAKEKRIKAAYQNGIDTLEEYKANKDALNNERRIIDDSIRELTPSDDVQDKELLDQKMRQNISDLLCVIKDDSIDYVRKGNMMRNVVDHIVFNRKETSLDVFLKLVI